MTDTKNFPTLYKKASTGKIQVWKVWVEPAADGAGRIVNEYGVLDGKMNRAVDVVTEGKNIGKVHETTPFEQACAEAQSDWEKKKKKHYVESVDEAQAGTVDTAFVAGGVAPMLAHKFDEEGHKISWPAFVQPKLDGHRCIGMIHDGEATLWSRTQKPIVGLPHIQRALAKLADAAPNGLNITLDGELYNHDYKDKFEQLSGFITSKTGPKPGHEVVQYWIYDVVQDLPFAERHQMLKMLDRLIESLDLSHVLCVLATFEAESKDKMEAMFGKFLEHGYEGAIVRNAHAHYKNKRSYDLQKVKTFLDDEFEIVDVEEGRGNMAGRAIFVCRAANGETFKAKMEGDLDNLARIWQNREQYIGRQLTVKFQGLSAYGIPRFPVGLRLREDV